ncbi:MAG TPA: hypothetical protein VFI09_10815 [Solirubrobacterales bacterium]|nr:hypothetical protein [Solirubrobacterales bacterium]
MSSRLREPFGKAGLIVAIVALVAALVGGAYAAQASRHHKKSKVLITKLNQIKPNVQKQLKGNAGPQGPKGDNGSNGSNGSNGAKGDTGAQGPQGIQGPKGDKGDPGTFSTEPLPTGQSLYGALGTSGDENDLSLAAISFPILVSPAPTALVEEEGLTHKIEDGEASLYPNPEPLTAEEEQEDLEAWESFCPGNVGEPKAVANGAESILCIYEARTGSVNGPASFTMVSKDEAANEFGLVLPYGLTTDTSSVRGSWAVTAG